MYPIDEVSDAQLAFPARLGKMLPPRKEIPKKYWAWHGQDLASQWFYEGLPKGTTFVPKEGVDRQKALRHLKALLGSFEPEHNHKMAAVTFLLDEWFEDVKIPEVLR